MFVKDEKLLNLLDELGHQVKGLKFTEDRVAEGFDPEYLLEIRKQELEKDINELIAYLYQRNGPRKNQNDCRNTCQNCKSI